MMKHIEQGWRPFLAGIVLWIALYVVCEGIGYLNALPFAFFGICIFGVLAYRIRAHRQHVARMHDIFDRYMKVVEEKAALERGIADGETAKREGA